MAAFGTGSCLWIPSLEFVWLKNIDFYPRHPGDLSKLEEICIASKSRSLGDTLMITTLPSKLRAKFPHLKVTTYSRAFNPIVFHGNPHLSGVRYLPEGIYGDDTNWGSGHHIQIKEQFFELPTSADPKPELYLLRHEREWARRKLTPGLPWVAIHPWGKTFRSVLDAALWRQIVARWSGRVNFLQLGVQGQEPIDGCAHYALMPRSRKHARSIFALLERVHAFLGVNSGPMHVARAFNKPGLIFTEGEPPEEVFANRKAYPYFLKRNFFHAFLYEANTHVACDRVTREQALAQADAFLERSTIPKVPSSG